MANEIITFLRRRDYKYIKELGSGACGKTVLLLDDALNLNFVCKKFAPTYPHQRDDLYAKFMNEIKLMHLVFHPNVVRVFNYYAYPQERAAYILMEYVEGETIDKYIRSNPDSASAVFRQTIEAFCHLEKCNILHRDIRVQNILVRSDGATKVIDLGFGVSVRDNEDFDKSITLNWPYSRPDEFAIDRYDFQTEVYFVGKLFEKIMADNSVEDDQLRGIVQQMVVANPTKRLSSFTNIKRLLDQEELAIPQFDEWEIHAYRKFSQSLTSALMKIDMKAEKISDAHQIIAKLENAYRDCMLEEFVSVDRVAPCLILRFVYLRMGQ